MASDKINFRFLSGDRIGASLSLGIGSYLIGNTDACEIQVNENDVNHYAIQLEIVSLKEVYVEVIEGEALVDKKIVNAKTILPEKSLLSFGLCSLMYANDESAFSMVALENLVKLSDTSKASDSTVVESENIISKDLQINQEQSAATTQDQKLITKKYNYLKALLNPKIRNYVYLFVGFIILGLLLASLLFGSWLFGSQRTMQYELSLVNNYIKNHDQYQNIKVDTLDKLIVIDGVLPNKEDIDIFINNLPKLSFASVINIKTIDESLKAIERAFAMRNATVKAIYNFKNHSVDLYGYMKDPIVEGSIFTQIKDEVNLENLILKTTYRQDLEPFALNFIAKHQLPLKLYFDDSRILYEGQLSVENLKLFNILKQELEKFVQAPVMVVQRAEGDLGDIDYLQRKISAKNSNLQESIVDNYKDPIIANLGYRNSDILGVTLTPMRFLSIKDGSRLFEGSVLPSGYTIKEISLHQIILEKEGNQFIYELK